MIRSSKITVRFTNFSKRLVLASVFKEYHRVVQAFVDILWERSYTEVRPLLNRDTLALVSTTLSARLLQCAGKQASGIVRGTRIRCERRLWRHNKLIEEGKHKQARKLWISIVKYDAGKPKVKNGLPMELDERFCSIELDVKSKEFDGWLSIASLGLKNKLVIPFKRTKHFNELLERGQLKKGVRLSSKNITFMFELPDVPKQDHGRTAGIDIGMTTAFAFSDGVHQWQSQKCVHGHDLASIFRKIGRKKKGSRAFREACQHRTNYINQQINKLPLDGIKQINIEEIRHMRRGKRSSRYMSHFTYAAIFERLKLVSEDRGVLINEVNPAFTSQRCSACGWTRKVNRARKKFQCGKCGYKADADLNASANLSLDLVALSRTGKKRPDNRAGFYWRAKVGSGKEPISPLCSRT